MVSITTSVSGQTVTISVTYGPLDVGLPSNWGVYVYAHTDHGLGSGGTDPNYTYFVERINGTESQTFQRTYFSDQYIAQLALQGMGVVDYSLFTIAGCTGANSITVLGVSGTWIKFNVCVDTCGGTFTIKNSSGGVVATSPVNTGVCTEMNYPVSLFTTGHYIAYLNGLDGSPLFESGFDVTIPPPPPTTYSCINNVCTQRSCTPGTANCYTTNNCNNICTTPPPPTQPCIPKIDEMLLFGTCIKKSYVYTGAGFFALMMILKK